MRRVLRRGNNTLETSDLFGRLFFPAISSVIDTLGFTRNTNRCVCLDRDYRQNRDLATRTWNTGNVWILVYTRLTNNVARGNDKGVLSLRTTAIINCSRVNSTAILSFGNSVTHANVGNIFRRLFGSKYQSLGRFTNDSRLNCVLIRCSGGDRENSPHFLMTFDLLYWVVRYLRHFGKDRSVSVRVLRLLGREVFARSR